MATLRQWTKTRQIGVPAQGRKERLQVGHRGKLLAVRLYALLSRAVRAHYIGIAVLRTPSAITGIRGLL